MRLQRCRPAGRFGEDCGRADKVCEGYSIERVFRHSEPDSAENEFVCAMRIFKRIFNREDGGTRQHAISKGERIYAVGDIHGRLDLLDRLLRSVEEDSCRRASATTRLVFLGDLVNRGAESKGVVERLLAISESETESIFLKGNHEEILVGAYRGDRRLAGLLHRVGGRETLMSYGVSPEEYDHADLGELTRLMQAHIPETHMRFLDRFRKWYVNGDYLFVHAGIRPGLPLEQQKESDLRWIRREFIESKQDHGRMIIHGHSICEEIDEQSNRIGIDTGAYASGRLTAIGLEATERWYLRT
jgi:serine/threonine protein phosphatase 1